MLFLSGSLYLVLFSVNFFVSKSVWIPFRDTISKLKNYKLAGGSGLVLKKTRITEFAQLNEVLKIMSDRIQQDFISLKEFTENASHEIQTPLAVIISRLELLIQSENLNELEMKLIQDTYNAAGRLSKLNQFLILLTKIENLQFRKTSKINIASVIDKYLSDLEEIIEQKNITITKQYASIITVSGSANSELQTMNYQLNINPTLADILVSNLISNAIKHNISGGEIIINISEKKLMISNTGEPLIQNPDELFERFKKARVDSESLGLGLSIVKKITEIYGMNLKYTYSAPLHNITISFPTKNNSMTND
jgi:signal transduction histidine kinase